MELVQSLSEAQENALRFQHVAKKPDSVAFKQLGRFSHWFYFPNQRIFAPSKFIGYIGTTVANYESRGNGTDTTRILSKFFTKLDRPSQDFDNLLEDLSEWLHALSLDVSAKTLSGTGGIYLPTNTTATLHKPSASAVGNGFVEGARLNVTQSRSERNPAARARCLEIHGISCHGCGFNFNLILVSRDATRLDPLIDEIRAAWRPATSYGADATDETAVERLFAIFAEHCVTPSLVVYALQEFGPGATVDVELPAFEGAWRHNCLGAFLVGRAAARLMKRRGKGSILLIGSTSSLLGREGHLNLAVGKFGQRALAQVLAREMWPFGVHVVHVVSDADIAESEFGETPECQSNPDDIAFSILSVHRQPRTAWTSEIDIRPWNERFWEHC